MPGNYLIIDLSQQPPALVSAEDVIPVAILQMLQEIKELIMTQGAAEQQQLTDMATAISAVGDHVTTASQTLAQWITDHQGAPLDFTGALNALNGLQAADSTLQAIVPVTPAQPLPNPVPDPGPPPEPDAPIDSSTPPDPGDISTPPVLPEGGDIGTATDPGSSDDQPQVNPL